MQKHISVDGIDEPIIFARRRGTRNLKIAISSDGRIRLSVPYGVPEIMAKRFIASKVDWIKKHHTPATSVKNGVHIGKNHRLTIKRTSAERHHTRITSTEIIISLPAEMSEDSPAAQKIIKTACEKALRAEADILLVQRIEQLAIKHGLPYKTVTIKKMKSRWGACDNRQNITLNSYLMQLDWSLIDYVICHELSHTKHQHHQAGFWALVGEICPDYKSLRKSLKSKPTDILSNSLSLLE